MLVADSRRKPRKQTSLDSPWPFRVWAFAPSILEDTRPYKLTALFRFLLEALDYCEACKARGAVVFFQSPNGIQTVKPEAKS